MMFWPRWQALPKSGMREFNAPPLVCAAGLILTHAIPAPDISRSLASNAEVPWV